MSEQDVETESTQKIVDIIDPLGKLSKGFIQSEQRPDRNGLIPLLDPSTGKIIRVHPDRIRPSDEETSGSIAVRSQHEQKNDSMIASCPECGDTCIVEDDEAKCITHGTFKIVERIASKVSKSAPSKKKPELVDKDALAKLGELWIKSGVNFDADIEVESLYLIIGDRYCTFNIYGGTYGKKGNKPPIEEMMEGKAGYPVKDIEKLRKKWSKGKHGKPGAVQYHAD